MYEDVLFWAFQNMPVFYLLMLVQIRLPTFDRVVYNACIF